MKLLPLSFLFIAVAVQAAPIPADALTGGFAIGCQAYSFNRFSVFEAIEKTEQTGSKTIEFYPGQKLSKEEPNVKWGHDASDELIARVKEKLTQHGIRAVNYGVVPIPGNESEARKIFEFAKKLGLYGVTTESTESLDVIEKLVKEYDIRVCFHEHAKQPNNPKYQIWNPEWLRDLLKDRDRRIGACADIGHWQTSGIKALDGIKTLGPRVLSLHMKDRAALGPGQHDCIFGTGTANIGGVLAELKRLGFEGNISIEYEFNWDNSVPDIAQCIGFVRGWAAAHP
jgi:sugar phosphate isomerase/epimerase